MNSKIPVKFVFFAFVFIFASIFVPLFAEEKGLVQSIIGFSDPLESIDAEQAIIDLQNALKTKISDQDRLEITGFLASLQERLGKYADAQKNYSLAANLSATINASKTGKSIPDYNYLISAVRVALSCGDTAFADFILSTSFLGCTDSRIVAYIKLYSTWSWLCKAESVEETLQPVTVLQSLLQDSSAVTVHPQVLLTLWYVAGNKEAAVQLQKDFANSPEAFLVEGSSEMMPAPFWYFVVSKHPDYVEKISRMLSKNIPENKTSDLQDASKQDASKQDDSKQNVSPKDTNDANQKPTKQQLGFFASKANAENLVKRLKAAGFSAEIIEEKRSSGNTYYAVVVPENADSTIGQNLKKAGFECYPVY